MKLRFHQSAGTVLIAVLMGVSCMAADVRLEVRQIPGQAEIGTAEIHGVSAGEFRPEPWEAGTLNIVPDTREPLIEPLKSGVFRNIYAPSVVEVEGGWRVFYGAWDGVDSGHDRIYSIRTSDFLDFADRHTVIEHGEFVHVCNVNALRLPSGEYRLMCTTYPDTGGLNKPAFFTSPDGARWNGSPAPYPAKRSDIVEIEGYEKYAAADINGMNVILYEDGVYRLYFNNFKDWGRVYRATSADGRKFTFDGIALEIGACVNDVKKLTAGGAAYYLMGLHMNGDKLWYSLSRDGRTFAPAKVMVTNLGDADRYIVAHGWVVRGNRVLGFLYGAGAVPSLDRNRIWARWLQKKVTFVASDGARYEATAALGPDRQIIPVPKDGAIEGHFEVRAEDGSTVLLRKAPATLMSGGVYVVGEER